MDNHVTYFHCRIYKIKSHDVFTKGVYTFLPFIFTEH